MTELSTDSGRAAERLAIEVATAACADAAIDPAAIVPVPHAPPSQRRG